MRVNPEKKEEKERVTAALLRATLRLAAAHGFSGLGLREIARAADIAPTSFYRHFADMEELGLALISDLVGKFVESVVASIGRAAGPVVQGSGVAAVTSVALAGAAADPELMRFILAERAGAIATFRAALSGQLARVESALEETFERERAPGSSRVPPYLSEASVSLLLEACGRLLDAGPSHLPALKGRLERQIQALLSGREGGRYP